GEAEIARLIEIFQDYAKHQGQESQPIPEIPASLASSASPSAQGARPPALHELISFYQKLGALNATPDAAPYPLGSCTMKYIPELNERSAALPGFADIHPQAPIEDVQGALELLWETQEWFKRI